MSTSDESSRPSRPGDGTRHRVVLGVLAALTVSLAAILVVLGAGLVSGALKVLCLFAGCVVVALIVVLLPTRLRTTAGSFAAAFVAAAGVLPTFLSSDAPKTRTTPTEPRANAQYLADLVRHGPFTESLPSRLHAGSIQSVQISDPSAVARLDVVRLNIDTRAEAALNAEKDLAVWAQIETYPSPLAAARRKAARIASFVQNYGRKNVYGGCVDDSGAHGAGWTCVDARGYAYAEAAVYPSDNAHTPLATGTLAALLRYTDRLTKVAS